MKKRTFVLLIILAVVGGGFLIKKGQAGGEFFSQIKPLLSVYTTIQREYIEEIDSEKLIEGAIKGMVESLGDPHSHWLDKRAYQEMEIEREGKFGGLGIRITVKEGYLTVVSPISGTPAQKAGIRPGDRIIKINGESARGMSLLEAVEKLRGEVGTQVTVTIEREGEKPFDITLTRAIIQVPNIEYRVLEEGIGYLKIIGFTDKNTSQEVREALRKLKKEGIWGLILDLRYNPGGLFPQAKEVADEFLSQGVIVSTRGREGMPEQVFQASPGDEGEDLALVVLINEGSASASEIVAGAIKAHGRGVLVGKKTFGKGTVQSVIPLEDMGALVLTTAKYYTPEGRSIEGEGIEPNLRVESFKPSEEEKKLWKKLEESPSVKEFLKKTGWRGEEVSELKKKIKKEGIKVEEEFLKRFLRKKDQVEENDWLNDDQLLSAFEFLKSAKIIKTTSKKIGLE